MKREDGIQSLQSAVQLESVAKCECMVCGETEEWADENRRETAEVIFARGWRYGIIGDMQGAVCADCLKNKTTKRAFEATDSQGGLL